MILFNFLKKRKNIKRKVWYSQFFHTEHARAPAAPPNLERNQIMRKKQERLITTVELRKLYNLEHKKLVAALRENEALKARIAELEAAQEDSDRVWESMK